MKRVGRKQLAKIEQRLEEEYCYDNLRKERVNFQQAVADLGRSIASYMRLYRGVHDYPRLDSELRRVARKVLSGIFEDVFGAGVLNSVTDDGREFLGLGTLEFPEGEELEIKKISTRRPRAGGFLLQLLPRYCIRNRAITG